MTSETFLEDTAEFEEDAESREPFKVILHGSTRSIDSTDKRDVPLELPTVHELCTLQHNMEDFKHPAPQNTAHVPGSLF